MTYPPQQPGPYGDPYGQQWGQQQPGPYGQQYPGQQPPGYGQPDPYGQQWGQPNPYGQQPDPYGQQYPGQQPPGYGQPDPYGQYPGQQGQFGAPPGFGGQPPPPKKNKTWLWVALSAGAVVVVALLVTGFAAPGFFLSDDDDDTAAEGGDGAEATAKNIVDAVNSHDQDGLRKLACDDASGIVNDTIEQISTISGAKLKGVKEQSSDRAEMSINASLGSEQTGVTGLLEKQQGDWCVKDMQMGGSPADSGSDGGLDHDSPGDSDGGLDQDSPGDSDSDEPDLPDTGDGDSDGELAEIASDFVDAVNDDDFDKALTMACEDDKEMIESDLDKLPSGSPTVKLEDKEGSSKLFQATVKASGDDDAEGTIMVDNINKDDGCVSMFYAL